MDEDALDEVVVDAPNEGRAPTKPVRHGSIEIDFADAGAAAEFLELMARLIRTRARVRIVLE